MSPVKNSLCAADCAIYSQFLVTIPIQFNKNCRKPVLYEIVIMWLPLKINKLMNNENFHYRASTIWNTKKSAWKYTLPQGHSYPLKLGKPATWHGLGNINCAPGANNWAPWWWCEAIPILLQPSQCNPSGLAPLANARFAQATRQPKTACKLIAL